MASPGTGMKDDVNKDNPDPKPTTGQLFLSVFPSIMLPMFLAVVDQTIVATALPAIAASLGGVERVSWVVVAYLVAGTIAAPVYGQLRDVYGGRRMMFVALAIFLGASLFCAMATSIEMLTIGRILQGLGGGGLMTLTQALIGEAIPPRDRARYQGYLAGVAVSSSTFGPVVGGLLTQHFGWRSIFLVNLPLGLIAVLLTLRLEQRPGRQQAWSFDGMGLVLFVAFIVPLLLALQEAQRMSASALPSFLRADGRLRRRTAGADFPREARHLSPAADPPAASADDLDAAMRSPPATAPRWSRSSRSCPYICACCAAPRPPRPVCCCCR